MDCDRFLYVSLRKIGFPVLVVAGVRMLKADLLSQTRVMPQLGDFRYSKGGHLERKERTARKHASPMGRIQNPIRFSRPEI